MANMTWNIRNKSKYDTHANWLASNITPLEGELCVVVVPAETGAVAQEPIILFKVGDGVSDYKTLPFAGGLAADVHDWAKAAVKPTYTAEEIEGLQNFIAGEIQDTDTQYKLEQDTEDGHIIKLFSKAKDAEEWTVEATLTTVDTVYDDTAIKNRAAALEALVGTTAVAVQIANAIEALNLAETYDAKGAAQAVQNDLDAYKESNDQAVSQISAKVTTLVGEDTGKSARTIANEELAKQLIPENAKESLNELTELAAWIQSHPDDASAMNAAIVALQNLVGTLPEGTDATTVVGYIDALITAMQKEVDARAKTADLAQVAFSGNVSDLAQTEGDVIILDCGSATKNI